VRRSGRRSSLSGPTFHQSGHGFRPGRSCHTAIREAEGHLADGYGWVVDIDLEKFFDRVGHQRLMARLAQRVGDRRLLKRIAWLIKAKIVMPDGVAINNDEGVPARVATVAVVPRSSTLAALLEAETADRAERRERRRLIDARFPARKRLEDFRFDDNPTIPRATIAALAEGSWIDAHESVIFIGDSVRSRAVPLIVVAGLLPMGRRAVICIIREEPGDQRPDVRILVVREALNQLCDGLPCLIRTPEGIQHCGSAPKHENEGWTLACCQTFKHGQPVLPEF
jgi:hypothetical protein